MSWFLQTALWGLVCFIIAFLLALAYEPQTDDDYLGIALAALFFIATGILEIIALIGWIGSL